MNVGLIRSSTTLKIRYIFKQKKKKKNGKQKGKKLSDDPFVCCCTCYLAFDNFPFKCSKIEKRHTTQMVCRVWNGPESRQTTSLSFTDFVSSRKKQTKTETRENYQIKHWHRLRKEVPCVITCETTVKLVSANDQRRMNSHRFDSRGCASLVVRHPPTTTTTTTKLGIPPLSLFFFFYLLHQATIVSR